MTRKNSLPKFPDSYLGKRAEEYNSQKWMEKNQKNTTLKCVEFLYDEKLGHHEINSKEEILILDMGCGTGYSTEILVELGFRVVGLDILSDMITKAREKKKQEKWRNLSLVLGDINHIPFRYSSFDHSISISSYNFVVASKHDLKEKSLIANNTATHLNNILKNNGRIIIEFYPESEKELTLFTKSFIKNGFNGYIIKDNPKQKAGKSYLLLKKK
ncbi:MAG: class I SAM-dependent methyltransferase [Promethearchaeota archaeon]